MWDYFSMMFWVIVAVIGLVLYINPTMIVRHMYEGFNQPMPQSQQQQSQQPQQPQQPVTQLHMNSMLRNIEQLLDTPGISPDLSPTMPNDMPAQQYTSNTGREQPQESFSSSSMPQQLNHPMESSQALEQGRVFQQTKPHVKEIIRERIVEVPRACPRQKECPVCPDMRNYIRKDSIPCWACKL